MSWDWRRRATWSSSSYADQSKSIRNPRSPGLEGEGGGGGDAGGAAPLDSVAGSRWSSP